MKIEVTNIGRLSNGNHMASVIVFDADNGVEARKAIENTGKEEQHKRHAAYIAHESEIERLEEQQNGAIMYWKERYQELQEENKCLKADFEFATDAWRKGKKSITELQEENETMMHNNRELQSQINYLGNTITKALYETSYVPF